MKNIKKIIQLFSGFNVSKEDLSAFSEKEILDILEKKPDLYHYLDEEAKKNIKYILCVLKDSDCKLDLIPLDIVKNKDFITQILDLNLNPNNCFYCVTLSNNKFAKTFNETYLSDIEFYKECIVKCPALFNIAPENIKDDKDLLLKVIKQAKINGRYFKAHTIFSHDYYTKHPEIQEFLEKEFVEEFKKEKENKEKNNLMYEKERREDFEKNKALIEKMPTDELKMINALLKDFDENKEKNIYTEFFQGSSFFNDEDEYNDYYDGCKSYMLDIYEKCNKKKAYLNVDEEIIVFGEYIGMFYNGEMRHLVHYKGYYFFIYSEGDIGFACRKIAQFPLNYLYKENYEDFKDDEEDDEEDEDSSCAEFLNKDWSIYQNFLDCLDIKMDVNKVIKKIKKDYEKRNE